MIDEAGARRSLAERIVAPKTMVATGARPRIAKRLAGDDEHSISTPRRAPLALLEHIAEHSPFLSQLAHANPERLARLMATPPEDALARTIEEMTARSAHSSGRDDIQRALRQGRQEAALLIALADLGRVWSLDEVTSALTKFADAAVSAGLSHLLREAARGGSLLLKDLANPEAECGMTVLALGKLGSSELNYSSDIDIVVFFDPNTRALAKDVDPARLFIRMTQALARLLQERTEDGYALRVDLRLRPDPGSTAVAIALPAALAYYEMLGQNWERAALIKARPVAGDRALGDAILQELAPFIWRKYFDYAAIADIHAMKRQIHAIRGFAEITVAGHDLKLGRGGIREIEFFVQTQQLIFGGRRPALRGPCTLDMLRALAADGWIDTSAVRDLSDAYIFLRTVEHRLQMVADEQTQRLPVDTDTLRRFAKFCGFSGAPAFSKALVRRLTKVAFHYARLFEHAPDLDASGGSLVFTGSVDDPETIATLAQMGFIDPARAADTVRGWHFGRRPAVQSARAREVLTELLPALLQSFAGGGDPDAALAGFDTALTRMPAAVELFSILKSNAALRELFADILGGAPRLANEIASRPHLLDVAIDPSTLHAGQDESAYDQRAANVLAGTSDEESFLDTLRDFAHEESFLISVRTLSGAWDAADSGKAFAALAQSVTRATLARVEKNFARDHGQAPGGRCVILAMGRMGSREMTATSDLDLMLLYDYDEDRPQSNGARPLHALQYYTRLTQRLVSALTVMTRRGRLYEVDMRLRPSGRKGPLATQFRSFLTYQMNDAETWERMSLCRARVVAGDPLLAHDAQRSIVDILRRPHDADRVRMDAKAMRTLIAVEKGDSDRWDLKRVAGGLLDIEFIAQTTILTHAHAYPNLLRVETAAALAQAGAAGVLPASLVEPLVDAHRLYSAVMQMIRLTTEGRFDPCTAASGVLRRIAAAANLPDFRVLEAELARSRRQVAIAFEEFFGPAPT